MKKSAKAILVTVVAAGAILGAIPTASSSTVEGCVALPGSPCSYVATKTGRIVAGGDPWRVTIRRHGRRIVYTGSSRLSTVRVIRRGDRVSARIWSRRVVCPLIP